MVGSNARVNRWIAGAMLLGVAILPTPTRAQTQSPTEAEPKPSPTIEIRAYGRLFDLGRVLLAAYERNQPDSGITIVEAPAGMGVTCLYSESCGGVLIGRPPTHNEYQRVERRTGRYLVASPIAMDAVVFFAHPKNPVEALALDQLADVLTYRIHDWRDLGVGIDADPQQTCAMCLALAQAGQGIDPEKHRSHERRVAHPRTSDDTGDAAVVERLLLEGRSIGTPTRSLPTTDGVVGDVRADILALGMGGLDYPSDAKVVALKTDGSSPPILPDERSVQRREYPFAHYVYLVTAGRDAERLRAFSRWMHSEEGQAVIRNAKIGPIPLPSGPGVPAR